MRKRRIGLLGGSFNPAHAGHRHISRLAIRCLGLDELWWLVSPQNPLKSAAGMAPLAERMAAARAVARDDRRIRVSDIETRLGTRYTVDTVAALQRRFPRAAFVWVAGADLLAQLPRWRRWTRLMEMLPLAVFDRPPYAHAALASKTAGRYRHARLKAAAARRLATATPPAWVFIASRHHPASATAIRRAAESRASKPGKESDR